MYGGHDVHGAVDGLCEELAVERHQVWEESVAHLTERFSQLCYLVLLHTLVVGFDRLV